MVRYDSESFTRRVIESPPERSCGNPTKSHPTQRRSKGDEQNKCIHALARPANGFVESRELSEYPVHDTSSRLRLQPRLNLSR